MIYLWTIESKPSCARSNFWATRELSLKTKKELGFLTSDTLCLVLLLDESLVQTFDVASIFLRPVDAVVDLCW